VEQIWVNEPQTKPIKTTNLVVVLVYLQEGERRSKNYGFSEFSPHENVSAIVGEKKILKQNSNTSNDLFSNRQFHLGLLVRKDLAANE